MVAPRRLTNKVPRPTSREAMSRWYTHSTSSDVSGTIRDAKAFERMLSAESFARTRCLPQAQWSKQHGRSHIAHPLAGGEFFEPRIETCP